MTSLPKSKPDDDDVRSLTGAAPPRRWPWTTALLCVFSLAAQTRIDLGRQGKNVDFSGAPFTKPSRMGASLPGSCSQGETFFLTTAQPGANLHLCSSANTWSVPTALPDSGVTAGIYGSATQVPSFTVNSQGIITGAFVTPVSGGGSASQSADLVDCKVTVNGATAIVATPCRVNVGPVSHSLGGNAVATLSGISSSGTAYFYWDSSGTVRVDQNSPATLSCNSFCTPASTGSFPISSFPIATATFTANSFNNSVLTDLRSVYSNKAVVCGLNLTCTTDGNGAMVVNTGTAVPTNATIQSGSLVTCNDAGTVNALACSLSQPLTGYTTGMTLQLKPANTNTASSVTLNIDSLGAVPLKQADGGSPGVGQIVAGQQVTLWYDGNSFRLPAATPFSLGGYEAGAENAAAPLAAGDLANHSVVIVDASARTLTEASCQSDAGSQTIALTTGDTTLFSITCANPISYGTTDGTSGYITAPAMAASALSPHAQIDMSGTANGSTKSIKLHLWGR